MLRLCGENPRQEDLEAAIKPLSLRQKHRMAKFLRSYIAGLTYDYDIVDLLNFTPDRI